MNAEDDGTMGALYRGAFTESQSRVNTQRHSRRLSLLTGHTRRITHLAYEAFLLIDAIAEPDGRLG
jgi:hypothetical protein